MKKMRRLIPAVAMLMVAAVMLSTASFAWFTMNDKVEATGMTVQAKSNGSLVIDTKPLTSASTGWEAKFAHLGNYKLSPVSYGGYIPSTAVGDVITPGDPAAETTGWFDALLSEKVDSNTGASDYFKTAQLSSGGNYIDYVVYIGLASESEVKNIQVTLATDLNLYIAGAYAVAFYVDEDITSTETIDASTVPALVLHCTTEQNLTRADGVPVTNTGKLFAAATTIPSTVGVAADGSEGVGIKVTMRVYIDGNQKDGKTYTPKIAQYVAASGAFDPGATYYTEENGVYTLAALNPDNYITGVDGQGANTYRDIESGYYVFDRYVDGVAQDTYFVNSAHAPDAPSQLNVSFQLVED